MSAQEFLRRVEQTGMVSEPLLEELRKRVADTHRKMRPEILAKLLVDRGELTAAQARKLVTEALESSQPKPPPPPPPPPPESKPESKPEEEFKLVTANDDLDFASEDDDLLVDDVVEIQASIEQARPDPDDLLLDIPLESPPPKAEAASHQVIDDEDEGYGLAPEDDIAEAILLDDEDEIEELANTSSPRPAPIDPSHPVLDEILADTIDLKQQTKLGPRRHGLTGLIKNLYDDLFGPRQRARKKRWDSPLILLGGGALILLVAAGFGLFALFYSETADEVFTAGKEAYESQSYTLAINNFERFSQRFPLHEKASLARVRIGMSKIRQITDATSPKWEAALREAQQTLPEIKQETSFADARSELAKLLPDIASGLVEASKAADTTQEKERVVALANDAMGLINNPEFLPTSVRQPQDIRIEEIQSNIEVVNRSIQRDLALARAIQQITASADAGNITEAYQLRDELVTTYPLLTDDASLLSTLASVTAKERNAVQVNPSDAKPLSSDHPPVAKYSVVLSDQRGEAIQGVDDHVLGVLVRGAAYGLDASDGTVLWRRYVGYETNVLPRPIEPSVGSDFLIVDSAHSEVQRVNARTGKLVWRLPCARPISTPQIYGTKAFVSCGTLVDSRLLAIDVASGVVAAEVKFPVGCESSPGVNPSRNEIVQVGTHSSGYVLDAESLACKSVFAIGHARGSIVVPPVFVGNSIVVAENNGSDASQLHVFGVVDGKDNWARTGSPIAVSGQIITPPAATDQRMLVASELGELRVLESPVGGGLRHVASISAGEENLGASYTLLDRSSVWVANKTFGRYELQSTRGKLVAKWARDRDNRFLSPLQRQGSYLFHVRRRTGMMGATVAATRVTGSADDGTPVWETDIGVPSAVVVDSSNEIHAVTMNGAMFPIDAAAVRSGVTKNRSARIDQRLIPRAFTQQISTTNDTVIFAGPGETTHVVVAKLQSGQLERIPLRIDQDRVTAELATFRDALLGACAAGPIYLVDATSGRQKLNPFMPRMEPGQRIDWLRPAPIGDDQFVAAEKTGQLYRVAVSEQQLTMARAAKIDGQLVAGLAAVGNVAFGVTRAGGSEQVVAIDANNLTIGTQTPLGNGLAWGPKRIGALVFVADHDDRVYAFAADGKLHWKIDEPIGPLAGDPLLTKGRFVFTSTSGLVSVVDQNGRLLTKTRLTEPLGSGAVAYKDSLIAAGWDGTLYVLDVPQ